MQIEIVTHCHRYGRLLTYQLSSLCLFPPETVRVRMNVFHSPQDGDVERVLRYFQQQRIANVEWCWHQQSLNHLFQRAIGRNQIARRTTADLVWFTDADILFRDDALDRLPDVINGKDSDLFYPRRILTSRDHEEGDRTIQKVDNEVRVIDVDVSTFAPQRLNRAVGPMQICRAPVLQKYGYCDTSQFQRFQRSAAQWTFRSDVAFRRSLGTGTPIDLPGVYRIRHSRAGYSSESPVYN